MTAPRWRTLEEQAGGATAPRESAARNALAARKASSHLAITTATGNPMTAVAFLIRCVFCLDRIMPAPILLFARCDKVASR